MAVRAALSVGPFYHSRQDRLFLCFILVGPLQLRTASPYGRSLHEQRLSTLDALATFPFRYRSGFSQ